MTALIGAFSSNILCSHPTNILPKGEIRRFGQHNLFVQRSRKKDHTVSKKSPQSCLNANEAILAFQLANGVQSSSCAQYDVYSTKDASTPLPCWRSSHVGSGLWDYPLTPHLNVHCSSLSKWIGTFPLQAWRSQHSHSPLGWRETRGKRPWVNL